MIKSRPHCVYHMKNNETDEIYFGTTFNPAERFYNHAWHLRNGDHTNPLLQASYDKSGPANFEFKVLFGPMSKEDAEACETTLMNTARKSLNIVKKQGVKRRKGPKISEYEVGLIRAHKGTIAEIMREFGINGSTASRVRSGKYYQGV